MSVIQTGERPSVSGQLPSAPLLAKAFARHETFHLRYGWLKKGFDLAASDPEGFLADDAAVRLGVGKNMVRSIRYWCRAFKLTTEAPSPTRPRVFLDVPTEFGRKLMCDKGWDPYLENPESLWLLHWRLLQPTCSAPSWYAVFNGLYLGSVTADTLFTEVALLRDAQTGWADVVDSSLRKDVDCLLRMYAPRHKRGRTLEDSLDSPLSSLRLLVPVESDRHAYTFRSGPKEGLTDEVIVFTMMEHLAAKGRRSDATAMLSGFVYDEGSPGRVFKLTETDLRDAVHSVSTHHEGIELAEVAGSLQVVIRTSVADVTAGLLGAIYRNGVDHA